MVRRKLYWVTKIFPKHVALILFLLSTVAAGAEPARPPSPNSPDKPAVKTFKAAAVQAISEMANPDANRRHLAELVRQAAAKGAKVIVLPETAITGYMKNDLTQTWHIPPRPITDGLTGISPAPFAETVPGPSTNFFCPLAKELGIYLTIPLLEVDRKTSTYYNTLILADPKGAILLHYRKLHPWPFAEQSWAAPGDHGIVYTDTPLGRMSLLICYDINFEPPALQKLNVDLLLYSIAWVDKKDSAWFDVQLPAIAKQNNLNIIGANWTIPPGLKVDWFGYGQSRILSRTGQILARPDPADAEQILYADIPISKKL
jgi:predicted amidohydrolase